MNKRQRQLVNTLAEMVAPVLAERPAAAAAAQHRAPGFSASMVSDDTAEIMMYGRIGADIWSDGITSSAVAEALGGIKASNIHVRINSGGGDVFEGVAIHTLLRRHPATVTTFIDGLAASAASFIAQAGDRIVCARNAMMMIHDGMTGSYGNANTMRRTAELLDKVSANIADMYAARAGEDAEHWRALMTVNGEDGSWFTGFEAVDAGLADEITDPDEDDAPVSALVAGWSGLLSRAPEKVRAHLDAVLAEEREQLGESNAEPSPIEGPDPGLEDGAFMPDPEPEQPDVVDPDTADDAVSDDLDAQFRFAMQMTHWRLTNSGRHAQRVAA